MKPEDLNSWPSVKSDGTSYTADTAQLSDRMEARYNAHLRTGTHLWFVGVLHEVDPSNWGATPRLDESNIISVNGPGCYICEEPYSERAAHRRCPGEPQS
jgi:hypothetical protein